MKKSEKQIKTTTITITEWYEKVGKKVYSVWKYEDGHIERILTSYRDIPYVVFKSMDFTVSN